MEKVMNIFQAYMGTGVIMIWFLISVVYLFFREKRRPIRILFLYTPIIVLLLFFNPLFVAVFHRLAGEQIIFRICWLLPMTVVIAYAIILAYNAIVGKKKMIFAGVCAGLIVISGKLVYNTPLFTVAENIYHVPQQVVDLCDRIVIPGREVMAVFPREYLLYVRQYTPLVCMPYGRESLQGKYVELEVLMNQEVIHVERMARLAKEAGCHYIIMSDKKELDDDMEKYNYELFDFIDGYVIYKDLTMNYDTHM